MRGPGLYIMTSMTPTSTQALRNHGLLLSDYVASGVDRGVMLVPDGVAQITLDDFRLLAPRKANLDQVPPTTSMVTDNVALLQITGLTERNLHLNPHALGRYNTQEIGLQMPDHVRGLLAARNRPDDLAQPWTHTDPPHHHQPPARHRHPPPRTRHDQPKPRLHSMTCQCNRLATCRRRWVAKETD